jgi:hypothetical protein
MVAGFATSDDNEYQVENPGSGTNKAMLEFFFVFNYNAYHSDVRINGPLSHFEA